MFRPNDTMRYHLCSGCTDMRRGLLLPCLCCLLYKDVTGASLPAEILLQKYEYHMPFYCRIKELAHLGMAGLKEATITGWFNRSMEVLRPLYNALVKEMLKSDYCQADETTTNVINSEKHATDREYVWMIRAVTEKLAAFFYEEGSRFGKIIKNLTDRHNCYGYLQCDGFAGYTSAYKPHILHLR
ncbi:IS66 family transposase [Bacteroides muris (ex Fokt et al. 2023)]|uniref:IS66 family transposase n=1 Tax=Bacteroides muris (ex Fokt et al. 2023) TaxID=2937417 RepID=A0A9X2NVS3_9BACE|nr:IS66 family transposase [Bacteroides muris (ex Fokt et al. 2023)]MCR6506169.1 IS66 family transposase [Bacteroides muris (ex Fokt et al. 2023)]